jgi:hypothetical protein
MSELFPQDWTMYDKRGYILNTGLNTRYEPFLQQLVMQPTRLASHVNRIITVYSCHSLLLVA